MALSAKSDHQLTWAVTKISANVPDSFSRDAWGFEFRNGSKLCLSENSYLHVKIENESGKSSELLSLLYTYKSYLRYGRLTKLGDIELSDIPKLGIDPRSMMPYIANRRESPRLMKLEIIAYSPLKHWQEMGTLQCESC